MVKLIGILALQGNFQQHSIILDRLGVKSIYVRNSEDLFQCDALIIPGGESTAMSFLIDKNKLRDSLIEFSLTRSMLGVCAGMIILSSSPRSKNLKPLNIIDISVNRNAWGRQIHSFRGDVFLNFGSKKVIKDSMFIRAPKIASKGDDIEVLGSYNDDPVFITNGKHYACSFHPEIDNKLAIHLHFLEKINERISTFI